MATQVTVIPPVIQTVIPSVPPNNVVTVTEYTGPVSTGGGTTTVTPDYVSLQKWEVD